MNRKFYITGKTNGLYIYTFFLKKEPVLRKEVLRMRRK